MQRVLVMRMRQRALVSGLCLDWSAATLSGLAVAGLGLTVLPATLAAQEVVQQLPNPASETLNDAMRRLSRNPASLPALLDAGRASINLGDLDAAEGFYERAEAIAPTDGAVLAGKALLAVHRVDPLSALRLFDAARAAGTDLDPYAADHGLALDLTGQNAAAQERYGVALAQAADPEVERRLALSYAMAGDRAASEAMLLPLMQRGDRAAYRTHAFALAILGREEEAVAISEAMLPARIALRMDPYLRHMRRLTPSQQAAAANLGVFPASADIGLGDTQLARRIEQPTTPALSGTSDARLIPGGAPLGPSAEDEAAMDGPTAEDEAALARTEPVAPPVVVAAIERELPPIVRTPAPPPPAPAPPPPAPRPAPAPVVVTRLDTPAPVPAPAPAPSISIAEASPVPAPAAEEVSLAEAFAAFTRPAANPRAQAAAGAVDITAIVPVREVRRPPPPPPPPPSPPPPPPHPSRHWVQLATGQDIAAFRFDWRRLVRTADGALDGREPYRARWGQTNRLVTGPFASTREAQAFVARLAEAGIDSFRFTSSAGEEVVELN